MQENFIIDMFEYLVVFDDNDDPIGLIYFTILFEVTTLYMINVVVC